MAALIAVDQCLCAERNPVLLKKSVNRFKDKIYLKGITKHICQHLSGKGVEDCGQVEEHSIAGDICNICQEDFPGPARRKIMCKRFSTKSRMALWKQSKVRGRTPCLPVIPAGGVVCAPLAA